MKRAVAPRILEQTSEELIPEGLEIDVVVDADHDLDAQGLRPAPNHLDRLWMTRLRHEEYLASLILFFGEEHGHRFGRRRGLVQ